MRVEEAGGEVTRIVGGYKLRVAAVEGQALGRDLASVTAEEARPIFAGPALAIGHQERILVVTREARHARHEIGHLAFPPIECPGHLTGQLESFKCR